MYAYSVEPPTPAHPLYWLLTAWRRAGARSFFCGYHLAVVDDFGNLVQVHA